MLPKALASAIIVVVTVVWAANFAAQFVIVEYKPDPVVHGIFMSIVGGALALSRKSGGSDAGTAGKTRKPNKPAKSHESGESDKDSAP